MGLAKMVIRACDYFQCVAFAVKISFPCQRFDKFIFLFTVYLHCPFCFYLLLPFECLLCSFKSPLPTYCTFYIIHLLLVLLYACHCTILYCQFSLLHKDHVPFSLVSVPYTINIFQSEHVHLICYTFLLT